MKHYEVLIEETVVGAFEVEADNADDAIDKAIENYKKCIFVNEPGELIAKQVAVVNPPNNVIEWIEF